VLLKECGQLQNPEFRPLDRASVAPLVLLKMAPGDDDYLAPNAITMGQALFDKTASLFGIWMGDEAAGFIAYCDKTHPDFEFVSGEEPGGFYLWRFMVGADFQRRGIGSAGLAFVEGQAKARGLEHVSLSAQPGGPRSPIPFYEKNGYARTGHVHDGEVELIKRL